MAVHRTREQKQKAQLRRTQVVELKDLPAASLFEEEQASLQAKKALKSVSTRVHGPDAQTMTKYFIADIRKTFLAVVAILLLLLGLVVLL